MVSPIEVRAQRLLAALGGIVSAKVVAEENGRLAEIHILASPEFHPKQIVRNIESALSAGLGIIVDRRIISVAQLRSDAAPQFAAKPKPAQPRRKAAEPRQPRRVVYVQYDAKASAPLDSRCRVVLMRGEEELTGTASGVNTPQGRADAAARAVLAALQSAGSMKSVGLEGTALVHAQGKTYVLVSARFVAGRNTRTLTGIATLGRSPEEAAIFAALQATNRLAES
ncbi:MAG TPA: hypothetical protein VGD27_09890 [Longimicrobiales bacterium]